MFYYVINRTFLPMRGDDFLTSPSVHANIVIDPSLPDPKNVISPSALRFYLPKREERKIFNRCSLSFSLSFSISI